MRANKHNQQIEHFYHIHDQSNDNSLCRVHRRENFDCDLDLESQRRNFYKISLVVKGSGLLFYGEQRLQVRPNCLLFLNPNIPYAWHAETEEQTGYFLTFDAEFLTNNRHKSLLNSLPFKSNTSPVYSYSLQDHALLIFLFEQLLIEQNKQQINTLTAMQNYVELIIHQGINAQLLSKINKYSPSTIISDKFLDLLEQQFNGVNNGFTPQDYANKLSVHVNHLSRLLKIVTGKSTQQHIIERKILEAKTQLRQSNKRISEIAYNLGFNHASSFNHFFNKHQHISPKSFRSSMLDSHN